MKRLQLLLFVFILIGCQEDEPSSYFVKIGLVPHSSLGEFYEDIPVTYSLQFPDYQGYDQVLWDFGDNITADGSTINNHTYREQGVYEISVEAISKGRKYKADTTITIVRAPISYGLPNTRESALGIYKTATNQYSVIYELNQGLSSSNYYMLRLNDAIEFTPSPVNLNLDTYPEIGPSTHTSNGTIALAVDTNLKIYAADGTHIKTHILRKYARDIQVVDNKFMVLFDSSKYAVVNSIDMGTSNISRMRQSMDVDGMTRYGIYFTGAEAITGYYRNSTDQISLVMESNFGGGVIFSQYFNEPVLIQDITPVSNGLIFSHVMGGGYFSEVGRFGLIKFDLNNQVSWRQTFGLNFQNFYGNISPTKVVVKEVGGFLFIFCDNMRCIKLSQTGQVIWDHYFYPSIAKFVDVEITSDGNFLLLGTRQYDLELTGDSNKWDLIFVTVSQHGERVIN
jgi:hypothetical protein